MRMVGTTTRSHDKRSAAAAPTGIGMGDKGNFAPQWLPLLAYNKRWQQGPARRPALACSLRAYTPQRGLRPGADLERTDQRSQALAETQRFRAETSGRYTLTTVGSTPNAPHHPENYPCAARAPGTVNSGWQRHRGRRGRRMHARPPEAATCMHSAARSGSRRTGS